MNQLILGDNLEIMRNMQSETIDLIYLDPPFFSNRNYEVIWGDEGEIRSFQDRWAGGIEHYIEWLKERVAEMHRLLKPTGSIYLHCDWHADAYIRVQILDKIFGLGNFRNEIIWHYRTGNLSKHQFQRKHDNIFVYSKSDNYTYNALEIKEYYSQIYGPETKIAFKGRNHGTDKYGDFRMSFIDDVWDLSAVFTLSNEHIGYPTQKPEKLLERIIKASSNEDDIVFDPFLGGGTAIVVAERLKRNWIGIDQSVQAIKVSEFRLNKQQNLFSSSFEIKLHKYDYDRLFKMNAFDFEKWIVEQFGGMSNIKQRGDFGMDGKLRDGTPVQVKQSEGIGRNVVDNFKSACERYDKALYKKNKEAKSPVGYIVAFSFGKGAIEEISRLKMQEDIEIKLMRVDAIVPIAKKPKLSVELKETGRDTKGTSIEFTAIAESSTGIEFYSYDFDYDETKPFNAEVILDKTGKQTFKFKPGSHIIAVKAIDNEGMEAIEVVKIKVNGEVEVE
ncbi:MAG: hypothetical protein A2X61_09525 [Ignavibacteria bacterium GWB2_35_12]|nr:MAG: hypothetical protein A2X61_09525 [Ignavibacteria bacterium GWB2_35_12]OGU95886.1 MAG: hypothetical protein A2220_03575 [Ignavibacteria bacterium RIFOXYA2_FULL_35_10]OGV20654.1 MAG: hypothetical protein A2475_03710 [Ignavibacteria bacterium RIFOXYC2_FULL_35_21]